MILLSSDWDELVLDDPVTFISLSKVFDPQDKLAGRKSCEEPCRPYVSHAGI
jgi:hypothetical protein